VNQFTFVSREEMSRRKNAILGMSLPHQPHGRWSKNEILYEDEWEEDGISGLEDMDTDPKAPSKKNGVGRKGLEL